MYTLYHDDCLDRMKQLANDGVQVDLILTDPPYGTIKTLGDSTEKFNKNRGWDTRLDTKKMYNSCASPSKHAYEEFIDVFDLDSVGGILTFDELKRIDNEYKKNHPVIFNLPGNSKFKSNILEYKKDHYNKLHPTQKPVALLEDLIKTYTNPGDLVLDFTMGSGSTGVACQNTDRDFIGIELDENYFKIAEKRLKENTVQTNLITNNNEVKGESK